MSWPRTRSTLLTTCVLVMLYWLLEQLLSRHAVLDEAAYHRSTLTVELARSVEVLTFLVVATLTVVVRPSLRHGWSQLTLGRVLHPVVIAAVFVLVFDQTFAPENPYFRESYLADRALLIVLGLASIWRPAALVAFLPVVIALVGQKTHPLGAFIWAFDLLPIRVLLACFVAWLVEGLSRVRASREGLVVLVAVIASQYFYPGVLKAQMRWPLHEHLENLLFGARAAGWLAWVSSDTLLSAASFIDRIDPIIVPVVLLLELGAALAFFGRRTLVSFLLLWVLFHVGIFVLLGYCFWKWVIIEATLAIVLLGRRDRPTEPAPEGPDELFTRTRFVTVVLLVATAPWWSLPANLAWIDTRLAHSFRVEVETTDGEVAELPSSWFGTYQDQMTMGLFGYLSEKPLLTGTYGITHSRLVADRLHETTSLEEIRALQSELGQVRYDEDRSRQFRTFLLRVIERRTTKEPGGFQIPCFWMQSEGPAPPTDRPVRRATVQIVTSLYDGETFREIDREAVLTVETGALIEVGDTIEPAAPSIEK